MKTWVGQKAGCIAGFRTKREALSAGLINPQRVDFGLHGIAWVQIDHDGILLRDGRKAPVHSCFPVGCRIEIVGLRDRESVYFGHKYRDAWVESFDFSVNERCLLRLSERNTE